MIAPETPVPIAVPRVSERLRALVAVPCVPDDASLRTISDERRVGEAHPETGKGERRDRPGDVHLGEQDRAEGHEADDGHEEPARTNRAVGQRLA